MPDNRIRLTEELVDFSITETTGQEHDTVPEPGQPVRYDWFRSYLTGLLASQSSDEEPTQKRTGTIHYDRKDATLRIWDGKAFQNAPRHLRLDGTTLQDWFQLATALLQGPGNGILTFSGTFDQGLPSDGTVTVPLPASIRARNPVSPVLHVDGRLADPQTYAITGCALLVDGGTAVPGARYTVTAKQGGPTA